MALECWRCKDTQHLPRFAVSYSSHEFLKIGDRVRVGEDYVNWKFRLDNVGNYRQSFANLQCAAVEGGRFRRSGEGSRVNRQDHASQPEGRLKYLTPASPSARPSPWLQLAKKLRQPARLATEKAAADLQEYRFMRQPQIGYFGGSYGPIATHSLPGQQGRLDSAIVDNG